uniref:J domain-containing protein n=1 Tax=Macrostomum lignano TaxID=282301 RepID=A0A1I8FLB6_9PLAT
VQAGERLHTLEDTWVHLVMKNYELEREIADLETAVSKAEAERPLPQTEKSTEPEAARVETAEAAEASDDNDELPPTPPARQSPVPTPPPAWIVRPVKLRFVQLITVRPCDGIRISNRIEPDADSTTAEDTTDQFRQIQRAYEILGDPRTRALYDQHREAILRQRDTQWEPETDSTNPFNYFPPGCYSNYGDGPGGFFDVYGRLFDKLAGELNLTLPAGSSIAAVKSFAYCSAFVKAWDPRVFNWRVQAASQLITGLAEEEGFTSPTLLPNRGGFVSLADAIRSMPRREAHSSTSELTVDAMRDMNAMDSGTGSGLDDLSRTAAHQRAGGVRCYYELLECGAPGHRRHELKKAYRRLALRWHPDKNPRQGGGGHRPLPAGAEGLRDAVRSAGAGLAGTTSTASAILKGGLGRGDAYQEERLDFFTSACYDDYDDGEEGYFTVYARVFSDLAEEERRRLRRRRRTPPDFPEFGRSDSPYDTVVRPFYAHWETFFTRKSYVWVEKYDTREAPNKYARKAMEKENRAAETPPVESATKRFELWVAFVKKRDPRCQARAREVEAKAKAMASAARKAHLETASRYRAPDWARTDDLEAELAKIEAEHGAGASDLDDDGDWEDQEDGGEEGAG